MNGKPVILMLTALALAMAAPADKATDRTAHLKWRDLDRLARGHRIAVVLPSGIKLQGDPIAFKDDELVLDVHKTSDKHAYPKGRGIVPRAEVQRCRILKTRGNTWRLAGTAIGAGTGALAAYPVASYLNNEGHDATAATVMLVGIPAALGYLAGWAADRRVMEIIVEPD